MRAAAYVVCVRDGMVLLAGGIGPAGTEWTLPGGGLEHGEDPVAAAVREFREETGYEVRVDRLLVVDSVRERVPDREVDMHGVRIFYAGTVTGGDLAYEIGGSTDRAAWFPLAEVPRLVRVSGVDVGLAAAGHPGGGDPARDPA